MNENTCVTGSFIKKIIYDVEQFHIEFCLSYILGLMAFYITFLLTSSLPIFPYIDSLFLIR